MVRRAVMQLCSVAARAASLVREIYLGWLRQSVRPWEAPREGTQAVEHAAFSTPTALKGRARRAQTRQAGSRRVKAGPLLSPRRLPGPIWRCQESSGAEELWAYLPVIVGSTRAFPTGRGWACRRGGLSLYTPPAVLAVRPSTAPCWT